MKRYNFSDQLQQVIREAENRALEERHAVIVPVHLMTSLLELKDPKVDYWLKIHNIDPQKLLALLTEALLKKEKTSGKTEMTISDNTREALRLSGIIAMESQEPEVRPLHLLLALLHEADEELAEIFVETGVELSSLDDLIYIDELKRSFTEDRSLVGQFSVDICELIRQRGRRPLTTDWKTTGSILEVLSRIYKNTPLLVGNPGMDKSLLVEGIVQRIAKGEGRFDSCRVLYVLTDAMMGHVKEANAFVELLRQFLNEAAESPGTILYFDEIYPDFYGSGPLDLPVLLKPALRQGSLRIIGASKRENISMILDQDPFLKKKIQIVKLKPLSTQKALKIIYESKSEIEEFHNVIISAPVANQAFYLSGEYFSNGEIEGTLQLLDMAATRVRLKARTMSVRRLKSEDLYQAVSDSLGVPSWRISGERKFYDAIPKKLKERIIGQDEAVERVARVITTREAPFNVNPRMPNGIMLFVGPRGVGKKELIHGLADVLFGDSERISAFDMARFEEPESLWELTGYSDKSKGEVYPSILTRILQKYPLSILFLEEIDKACPDVQRFFAEVFKTGAFEDSLGQRVSLSGVTVVMTVKAYEEKKQQLGFTHDSEIPCDEKAVHEGLASLLDPELMGIIDQVVIFKELRNNELKKIIRRNLIATLREKWDIEWIIGEKLLRFLVDEVKKEKDKLRSLERLFQIHVFSHLALALGRLDLSGRQRVALEFDGKELVVE